MKSLHVFLSSGSGIARVLVSCLAATTPAFAQLDSAPFWIYEGDRTDAHFADVNQMSAADVNGDGYADLIVGADGWDVIPAYGASDGIRGAAFAFHGGPSGLSVTPSWMVTGTTDGLAFGEVVSSAGDVNGDGYDDVVVGQTGGAFVYLGSAAGLSLSGTFLADSFTASSGKQRVASAGDVNGDGFDDVLVAGPTGCCGSRASLFLGSLTGITTSAAWTFTQSNNPSLTSGDFDGDGYDDVGVGTIGGVRINVFHGSAAGLPAVRTAVILPPVNLGEATHFAHVLATGDANGDGYDDLLVSAHRWGIVGSQTDGAVFLYLGSPTGLAATPPWTRTPPDVASNQGTQFGFALALADLDGDGFDDVLVGEPNRNVSSSTSGDGALNIYRGSATLPGTSPDQTLTGEDVAIKPSIGTSNAFGRALAAADFDGDGLDDVAVGENRTSIFPSDLSEGRALAFVGQSSGSPPLADAGVDFSVDEGAAAVMLDGSGSNDPDSDPLTYAWDQLAGTSVTLSDPAASQPAFDAPLVAVGGETLTFELTVSADGESDVDTVSVTVVNVNHPPVADAGDDQSIAEGSPVTLLGEDSFDVDTDTFTYGWVQTGGSPTVTLAGADTANPTFTAPFVAAGGAPGVVATLVFELTVDDDFPLDAPAPGYTFANVVDSVTVEITNLNNDPSAVAGSDQTVDENTLVALSGSGSSDPDSDTLTYAWGQFGGTAVVLTGQFTATPSFTTPFVSPGGEDLTFKLTVDDTYGGTATDTMVVHVLNANDPPLVSAAEPTIGTLWPPNHKLVLVGINGVSDPDNNATITIDGVFQDEPTNGLGDGDTAIDAIINGDGTVFLRAERAGGSNGRVYHIHFTAADLEGSASGVVTVTVPQKKKSTAVDDGQLYDSTN